MPERSVSKRTVKTRFPPAIVCIPGSGDTKFTLRAHGVTFAAGNNLDEIIWLAFKSAAEADCIVEVVSLNGEVIRKMS